MPSMQHASSMCARQEFHGRRFPIKNLAQYTCGVLLQDYYIYSIRISTMQQSIDADSPSNKLARSPQPFFQ